MLRCCVWIYSCLFSVNMSATELVFYLVKPPVDFYSLFCLLTVFIYFWYRCTRILGQFFSGTLQFWINFDKQGVEESNLCSEESDSVAPESSSRSKKKNRRRKRKARMETDGPSQVTEVNEEIDCTKDSVEAVVSESGKDAVQECLGKEEVRLGKDQEEREIDNSGWTTRISKKNKKKTKVTTGRTGVIKVSSSLTVEVSRVVKTDLKVESMASKSNESSKPRVLKNSLPVATGQATNNKAPSKNQERLGDKKEGDVNKGQNTRKKFGKSVKPRVPKNCPSGQEIENTTPPVKQERPRVVNKGRSNASGSRNNYKKPTEWALEHYFPASVSGTAVNKPPSVSKECPDNGGNCNCRCHTGSKNYFLNFDDFPPLAPVVAKDDLPASVATGEATNVKLPSENQESERLQKKDAVNQEESKLNTLDKSVRPKNLQPTPVTPGQSANFMATSENWESTRLVHQDNPGYYSDSDSSDFDELMRPVYDCDRYSFPSLTSQDRKSQSALPEVSPSPKKNSRRQRKRRNTNKAKFKSMDDSSDTSSTSDLSVKSSYTPPEKTTVYSPLHLYQKLDLDMFALYHEFHHYILTEEQLRSNGFPEESPSQPGRIVVRNPSLAMDSTERRCVRCSTTFHVQSDGSYRADEMCRYHARKPPPFRRDHLYRGDYPCCNGNYMSEGCVTWQYHVTTESVLHKVDFVKTKSKRHLNKITSCSVYGLDCEMLYTTAGMEVAKVGVVNAEGLTVFESFVLPQNQILDYNTVYSGITEKDLKGVTMTLKDVQAYLLKLLNEDSILVGHGLENDLRALRLIHHKVVDTSVVFPHEYSSRYKKSLKNLAKEFLKKQIQTSSNGHNCIEDARTCMELMLYRIDLDLLERPPVTQDENKNSILQNTFQSPPSQAVAFATPKYPLYDLWPYNDYSFCSNSYRDSQYAKFLVPKSNCIY